MDVDFERGFLCPDCGASPDKIVMDGTTLGIQKKFLPATENEVQFDDEIRDGRYVLLSLFHEILWIITIRIGYYHVDILFINTRFECRNFINRKSVRILLKRLVNGTISENELQQLKDEVQ